MKLAVFNIRDDEKKALKQWKENIKEVDIVVETSEGLNKSNMQLIKGTDGVVLAQNKPFEKEVYDYAKEQGIKVFATRSAGFDIYDLSLMDEYGIKMTNVPSYSPNAIAEHVVTTTLYILET